MLDFCYYYKLVVFNDHSHYYNDLIKFSYNFIVSVQKIQYLSDLFFLVCMNYIQLLSFANNTGSRANSLSGVEILISLSAFSVFCLEALILLFQQKFVPAMSFSCL